MAAASEILETMCLANSTLENAISETFGTDKSATAMLMSPSRYIFAELKGGKLCGRGGEMGVDGVYEAHIFNADTTLHWHRSNGAQGQASVHFVRSANEASAVTGELFSIEIPHLIWGKPSTSSQGGWSRLTAARIGGIDVPVMAEGEQRVRLLSKAWFECDSNACGNPVLKGITYSKLEVVDWPSGRQLVQGE